jgi:hypothetical protein
MLISCNKVVVEKTIRVNYQNGKSENVVVSSEDIPEELGPTEVRIYFNGGCLYTTYNESKYEANFTGCIRCGVESFYVLETKTTTYEDEGTEPTVEIE